MGLPPILAALYRNRVGAALIALQVTLTLAILSNALFVVAQRVAQITRPSGVDESDAFVIANQWIGASEDLGARVRTDLSALRSVPGVAGAYVTNAYPFASGGSGYLFTLRPDQTGSGTSAAVYFGDEQTLRTLDLKLIAGRNFDADDVVAYSGLNDQPVTSGVIITRALAVRLAPGGNALGRTVTMLPTRQSAPIVGIIDRLQVPWVGLAAGPGAERSALLPYRDIASSSFYVVRARPGQISAVMTAARDKLFTVSRARVIDKVQSFSDARRDAYRGVTSLAIMLTLIGVGLLAVTACGIVGLASFWVLQRRRQIGIRRTLGATRMAIMRYVQMENLLITGAGTGMGVALAVAANLWMVRSYSMLRLPVGYLITSAVMMLVLGQLAVLWPALRAALIPPAVAARAS